jgi:hypothetical protein
MPTIEEAIVKMAREDKLNDTDGEVIVPRRIIKFLEKKYKSGNTTAHLCSVYLEEYLK